MLDKIVQTTLYYDGSLQSRLIEEFNENNQIIKSSEYLYIPGRNEWVLFSKKLKEYNSSGKLVTSQEYDLYNVYIFKLGCNNGGAKINYDIYTNSGKERSGICIHEYDENAKLRKEAIFYGGFLTWYKEYDAREKLILANEYATDGEPTVLRNADYSFETVKGHCNLINGHWSYDYDDNGKLTLECQFDKNDRIISRKIYEHNKDGYIMRTTDYVVSPSKTTVTAVKKVVEAVNADSLKSLPDQINAMEYLLEKARQNDEESMETVAYNYYYGQNGFPRDDYFALYWSERVASLYPNPNYDVWYLIGGIYWSGSGVEKNRQKAMDAYLKSVEQFENPESMGWLAEIYYYDAPENEKGKCIPWLEKAYTLGHKESTALLGYLYTKGEFVQKNSAKGIKLLEEAAIKGDSQGAYLLAEAYLHRIDGSEYVVPYDISKAVQYFAIAVENGEDRHRALYYAGPAYFYGEGVPKNMEKARKCLEALIDDEDVPEEKVFDLLGCMCFEGIGGQVDYILGEKALRRAIGSDDTEISLEAMNNLGMYFYSLANRLPEAIQLLQSAADQGNANAQVNLAKAYYEGKGVSQNTETAVYYLGLAAEQGNQTAIDTLKVIGTSDESSNPNPAKKRHPIRGAIIGYFVGGLIGTILHLFWPGAEWISVIIGVIIGILKG